MQFLPYKTETLVSELPMDRLRVRLYEFTGPVNEKKTSQKIVFQGVIEEEEFRISQKIRQPNNFIPIISGKMEETRHGSLLFLSYKLFFSSVLFLIFWSVICLLLSFYLIIVVKEFFYAGLTIFAGTLNYVITIANFNKQVKISRQLLLKSLNI